MYPLSISSGLSQNLAHNYLRDIAKTYMNTKVLAFDGNIKYYTGILNTSPEEISMISYRRDGDKIHMVVGDQTVVYDGNLNIIINEEQRVIYVSSKKQEGKKDILPIGSFEDYINSGQFNINASEYVGNKLKLLFIQILVGIFIVCIYYHSRELNKIGIRLINKFKCGS